MAFWIKKKLEDQIENEKEGEGAGPGKKKKKDKEGANPKRIDNLRIPQQLRIVLKSLGSPNEYVFLTKDLSATGAFVLCSNFKRYPFQPQSTILDATVEIMDPDTNEQHRLHFLAKVARVVEAHGEGANQISGFGIRIVQISTEGRQFLEFFVARHGAPEPQAPELSTSLHPLLTQHNDEDEDEDESEDEDGVPAAV